MYCYEHNEEQKESIKKYDGQTTMCAIEKIVALKIGQ